MVSKSELKSVTKDELVAQFDKNLESYKNLVLGSRKSTTKENKSSFLKKIDDDITSKLAQNGNTTILDFMNNGE